MLVLFSKLFPSLGEDSLDNDDEEDSGDDEDNNGDDDDVKHRYSLYRTRE